MAQIARNITDIEDGTLLQNNCKYLIHDRDSKFCEHFDDSLRSAQIEPVKLPPRSGYWEEPDVSATLLGERRRTNYRVPRKTQEACRSSITDELQSDLYSYPTNRPFESTRDHRCVQSTILRNPLPSSTDETTTR